MPPCKEKWKTKFGINKKGITFVVSIHDIVRGVAQSG